MKMTIDEMKIIRNLLKQEWLKNSSISYRQDYCNNIYHLQKGIEYEIDKAIGRLVEEELLEREKEVVKEC